MITQIIYSIVGDQCFKHVFISVDGKNPPILKDGHLEIPEYQCYDPITRYYFDDLPACILELNDIQKKIEIAMSMIDELSQRKRLFVGAISQGLGFRGTHVFHDQVISFNEVGEFHIENASVITDFF